MGPSLEKERGFQLACTQRGPGAMRNLCEVGGNSEPASGCWRSWDMDTNS